jgi:hypothetical protein
MLDLAIAGFPLVVTFSAQAQQVGVYAAQGATYAGITQVGRVVLNHDKLAVLVFAKLGAC